MLFLGSRPNLISAVLNLLITYDVLRYYFRTSQRVLQKLLLENSSWRRAWSMNKTDSGANIVLWMLTCYFVCCNEVSAEIWNTRNVFLLDIRFSVLLWCSFLIQSLLRNVMFICLLHLTSLCILYQLILLLPYWRKSILM